MRKDGKRVWIIAACIAMLYVVTMLLTRSGGSVTNQYEQYAQWRSAYVMQESDHRSFVNTSNDRKHPVALSEGQGYGMYLTAIAGIKGWGRQQDYDELLNYYLTYRVDGVRVDGADGNTKSYLMQWRQHSNGHQWISQDSSATDGDLYIAYSLNLASKAWPKSSDQYMKLERKLASDILNYEYNGTTHTLTVGNWADATSKYHDLMRTSDVMPTFFKSFYESTHDRRWLEITDAMLDRLMDLSEDHDTGLVPDFAWVSEHDATAAKANAVASRYDGDYSSNACRVPMMLATSNDPRARAVVLRLLQFFNRQSAVTAGYTLAGKQLNDYRLNSFTAPVAYAASQHREHRYDRLQKDWQNVLVQPVETNRYYDATLTVMAVMGEVD
ncbi:glycosyl hydrolase family 8 [Bifidobacterium aquikefiricola]|uniref:Glycosyl hydrolase family 8 n=1 Tax=Bifidobacterium aquikefiricola TaxID=3059038 RepID=A0AB39U7J3_9BIFI